MTKQKTPSVAQSEEAVSAVLAEGAPSGASGNGTVAESVNPAEGEREIRADARVTRTPAMTPQPDISAFVTVPQVGAYRTQDHRYYWNGKGPYPSVTTILQVLDKPAVVQWAKRTVAEGAVNRAEEVLARVLKEPKDEVIRWLASMPDYVKDEAGKLGSSVHLLADMVSRPVTERGETFQVSEQEKPYLEAFQRFLRFLSEQGAEIVSSEKMVWSLNGYAGTYDLIVKTWCDACLSPGPHPDPAYHHSYCQYHREGPGTKCSCAEGMSGWDLCEHKELWLLDIKTSKGYYPEYALQLIAYGYADQIILEGNPDGYPMPKINRYGVLHLRPELYPDTGYRLVEYPLIEGDYIAFLAALELYRWKQEGRYTKSRLRKP